MLQKMLRVLAVLLAGFAGGVLAPWALGWVKVMSVPGPADAVAVANTYIVFTTIIFVGVTVLLAVAGYVFTQHFSSTKGAQERELLEELKERIKTDEALGVRLANAMLENSDVKRHLSQVLSMKTHELLRERVAERAAAAKRAANEADLVGSLASDLDFNGKGGS